MKIINIIDRFDSINFGVWNAAISTASILKEKYGVDSEIWYPDKQYFREVSIKQKIVNTAIKNIDKYIGEGELSPSNTIIVTHGCWQYPTKWGNAFKKRGYKWVFVPHAMLMPWCMNQKHLLKIAYFNFFEGRWAKNADVVRAVGYTELDQLRIQFDNVVHIPNGIELHPFTQKTWKDLPIHFVYLARIHKVKGINFLVQAWIESELSNNPNFKLTLAGPDDGELINIKQLINSSGVKNIEYLGGVFGEDKLFLLRNAHFFVMPSLTEGFSSSIVEAMQQGCIPIISEGCNMNHLFDIGLAIKANANINEIKTKLDIIANENKEEGFNKYEKISGLCNAYSSEHYSLQHIAHLQYQLYKSIL